MSEGLQLGGTPTDLVTKFQELRSNRAETDKIAAKKRVAERQAAREKTKKKELTLHFVFRFRIRY